MDGCSAMASVLSRSELKAVVMLETGGEINRMIINSPPGREFSRGLIG
jgi:hypothetical protein